MRKEIKDFLQSDDMVLYLPRDYSRDVISQWISARNVLHAPLNLLLVSFSKIIPLSSWSSAYFRKFLGVKVGYKVGFAQITLDYLIPEAIEIGDYSTFGWKVVIFTHEFTQHHQRFGKVKIGKNVLVGALSVIRPGISIGNNSIISPHSFVVCNIPSNELWGGNPAKKIRNLETHHISPNWETYKKQDKLPKQKRQINSKSAVGRNI